METKKIKCWDISHRQDVIRDIDETGVTLCARMGTGGNNIPIVLMDQGGGVMSVEVNKTGTLRAQTHGHEPVVIHKAEAYRISAEKSNAMLSDNPKSGIYKTELSPTLDTTIPTAQKAQGGLMVINKEDIVLSNKQFTPHVATDGKCPTLISSNNSEPAVINVEKDDKTYMLAENVIGRTDKNGPGGKGWTADVSFTLNATGVPAVCEKTDFINMTTNDKSCVPVSTMLATRGDRGSQENGLGIGNEGDPSYTLTKAHEHAVSFDGCVRRLLPVECERLMGFPETVELDMDKMTRDEVIVAALINKDIIVDCDKGKVYRTRGGQGRRLDSPIELKGSLCNGYLVATIHGKTCRKQVRLHRVIWIAKYGIPEDGLIVDHINGIKTDNRIANLQLLSPKENSTKAAEQGFYLTGEDNPCTKISAYMREQLFFDRYINKMTYSELAEKYGVTKGRIGQIIRQNEYTKIPYKGKPADQCPDGPRYKALGNSWAVPVVAWLGKRIDRAMRGLPVQNAVKQTPPQETCDRNATLRGSQRSNNKRSHRNGLASNYKERPTNTLTSMALEAPTLTQGLRLTVIGDTTTKNLVGNI